MTLGDSFVTCFSKYATFEGRATRSEYWWFWLVDALVSSIPGVGDYCALATLLPMIAVSVRRLHDTEHSGWWLLCPIYSIVLYATPSDVGTNKYGG